MGRELKTVVTFTEKRVNEQFHCPATRLATRGSNKGQLVPVDYALYWDDDTPGLGLRVTNSGARSYIFEKRVHGGTMRMTIGDPRSWKLDDARKRARELAVQVDKDQDPRLVAAAERAKTEATRIEAQRRDLVVEGVWHAYIEANKAGWGDRHLADHISLAHKGGERKKKRGGKGLTKPGPLAALMPLKLSELTSLCVTEWLQRESKKRRTSAAQAFRLLRAFIRWADDVKVKGDDGVERHPYKGIVPTDAYSAGSVRKSVPEPRTKEGDCLQTGQLAAWFKGVRERSNPVISAYLQTLLLTGARRESVASLRWADVDFKWGNMTLRSSAKNDNKGGNKRTISLTPYVSSLLAALPRVNEWVFSSEEAESGHLVEPTKAHNAALESVELPHITLHGLRRSFDTLAEEVDPPGGVVLQIQGHKPSGVSEKHYKRRSPDFLRKWHERIEAWFLEQSGVPFTRPGDKARLGLVNVDGSVTPTA